jgi:acyl-CoA synthetase (AMP-forming)/AMP-acid ligase II
MSHVTPSQPEAAMQGLMMDRPLLISSLLEHAAEVFPAVEIVTRTVEGPIHRSTWAAVQKRARQVAQALHSLELREGDAVATIAWNTHRHLELYYAVPMSGAVLTTLNIRLTPDDVAWVARHSGARGVFVDASLTGKFSEVRKLLPDLDFVVVMGEPGEAVDPALGEHLVYEELLGAQRTGRAWTEIDEQQPAMLCYTGGTTGRPKGVLYTHRAEVLHAMAALGRDSHAIGEQDVVLSLASLFHANGWALPYSAALAGATLVFPGSDLSSSAVVGLVENLGVTVAAAIPTVWLSVDQWLDQHPERSLARLQRILCGGAAVTEDLLTRFERRGITVNQAWGMTEMAPSGSMTLVRAAFAEAAPTVQRELLATAGVAVPGVELRIVDDTGAPLPHDGVTRGELEARGLWVISEYYRPEDDANEARFHDGWLRTGDVATIDRWGYVRIVDRLKDMVKSGGEWISSLDLEREISDHPDVAEVAVVGVPHPIWQERPMAVVVRRPGSDLDAETVREFLRSRVASWWLPDRVVFVDELPHTGVGKLDKRSLRDRCQDLLADEVVER